MNGLLTILMVVAVIAIVAWFALGRLKSALQTKRPQFANIAEGTYEDGKKSYLPDAATSSRYLLYKRGTDGDHCAVCGAAEDPLGPSDDAADAGIPIAIQLLGAVRGTVRVTTDGTLADGDYCKAAANGQVAKATTGDLCCGRASISTDMSSAAGDPIGMIPILPSKLSF